ncbi:MAG: hypothetical protein AAGF46_11030 [Pseudomonadota bacterium]
MTIGISAMGAYVPRTRLVRGAIADAHAWAIPQLRGLAKGQVAAANWDEDSVTMAHAATRRLPLTDVTALTFCSTTMPFADRSQASLLAEALQLGSAVQTMDVGATARAGTSALLRALQQRVAGSVIAAADKRLAKPGNPLELQYGDAAVAMRIEEDAGLAEFVAGSSFTTDFVDHYRRSDADFDYGFEDRWVRDTGFLQDLPGAINSLLASVDSDPGDVAHLILNAPARVRAALAKSAGLKNARTEWDYDRCVGQAGTAESLLGLSEALGTAAAGDLIMCIGFGQGADLLLFRALDNTDTFQRAVAGGQEDDNYLRFLSHRGLLKMDWGKRAERDVRTAQSAYYRERDQISGFVGGRCTVCGTLQFPRTQACVNPECRAFGTQEPVSFADLTGRVKSFTEDWQAYSPAPPLMYGNIEFDGGANILMQFTDTASGELAVGASVGMHFRIKDIDRTRQFQRYFWKATPHRGD